jgi:hypothetical protein
MSFILLSWVFKLDIMNTLFFTLGFSWNMAIVTPGLEERSAEGKYRFSFLRFVITINNYLKQLLSTWISKSLIRTISPLLFSFSLSLITSDGYFVLSIVGSLSFEFIYYFSKEYLVKEKFFQT